MRTGMYTLNMVKIPNHPPEPTPKPPKPPEPPAIVPRCCLWCNVTITFDDPSRTWRLLHSQDNVRVTERTFADEKIEEALPWLETLHQTTTTSAGT